MKKRELLIIATLILIVAFFFFKSKKNQINRDDSDIETPTIIKSETLGAPPIQSTSYPNSSDATKQTSSTELPLSDAILKRFGMNLQSMEKCLQLTSGQNFAELVNPTPENLIAVLRPSLGETVVQINDWTQFDIIDKAGGKKRIRVDFDYPDGVTPNRRLSVYTVNAYGGLEIDNLTNDQADNPNEAYVDSLREGNQVVAEEKAARVYFSQGEELVFSIKNGHLDSFSVSRADRAMNCTNVSDENSKCGCP